MTNSSGGRWQPANIVGFKRCRRIQEDEPNETAYSEDWHGGVAALVLTTGFGTVAGAQPVTQEGLVNLNLTGVTAQLPIDSRRQFV